MLDFLRELKQSDRGKYSMFETKYIRCRKIEELLKQKPMRRSDLARVFSVNKSTITRNVNDLSVVVPIREDEKGIYMLIKSERNTSHDLKLWKELEEADGIRAADLKQSKIDQAIIDIQGIAKEVCYVSVSWGKDSVVLAHLCVCAGIDVPFIWIVEKPFFNPDCLPVRDAFLKRFSIRYYEYEIEYTPDNMYSPKPFKEKEIIYLKNLGDA